MIIYVGNLNYRITSDDLREVFSTFGEVESATVITDRFTGRSKGFGFVTMGNDEEAKKAIQSLNGTILEGRKIIVNESRSKQ
ncbi:MAG: RNA-binding protein [Bacteroidales bacterium]|nr:RNA-binding protein [Bacteroidales bacterium]